MKRVSPPVLNDSSVRELVLLLSEDLKRPLVSISQLAELDKNELSDDILSHASSALKTIDNFLTYQRASSGQLSMKFEPVHVGSAMQQATQIIQPMLRASGCKTELIIQHGLAPVDADRALLTTALVSLWQGVLSTITSTAFIIFQAKKTAGGVRISLHSSNLNIDSLNIAGPNSKSTQPIKGIAGPAADILTAQGIFNLLGSELNRSILKQSNGLGATLKFSQQLQMV